jgi:hypothetical protein
MVTLPPGGDGTASEVDKAVPGNTGGQGTCGGSQQMIDLTAPERVSVLYSPRSTYSDLVVYLAGSYVYPAA